ncbi:hypothetical protein BJP25_04995 [Actinokineospora bangkokensis]|uniref:Fibronectin type-III domain-containing protein n=1 Tax=Actinokineospora bangkokensis TaxID=1193682 RepID=A0A1Q9LBQ0_9PSEU|nr:hypothetical protein BJP25_04995 [Actinokineospora bangkokensis]
MAAVGLAIGGAVALGGGSASAATTGTVQVERACSGPQLQGKPVRATFTATYSTPLFLYPPASPVQVGGSFSFPVTGFAGAATVDVDGTALLRMTDSLGRTTERPMVVYAHDLPTGAPGGYATAAVRSFTPYLPDASGSTKITVDLVDLSLTVTPVSAQGTPVGAFDTTCAGSDRWLDLPIVNGIADGIQGGDVTGITDVTATSVSLTWSRAYFVFGDIADYEVLVDGKPAGVITTGLSGTVTGLQPNTDYWFTVNARTPTGFGTGGAGPMHARTARSDKVQATYAATGGTRFASGLAGEVSGTLATTVTTSTGATAAKLELAPTTVAGNYGGVFPVSARVTLTEQAPTTGTLTAGTLTTESTVSARFDGITVFGFPVKVPATCGADGVPLRLSAAGFGQAGGTATGGYQLAKPTGCGVNGPLVSSLFSGRTSLELTLAKR